MKQIESSENSYVTLNSLLFYTREDKLPLGNTDNLMLANTVTALGYRGDLRSIDAQFATARTMIDGQYNAQVIPRDYYRPDLGREIFGARLPERTVHSLFKFFQENVVETATSQPSFDPGMAFRKMLGSDAVTWQTEGTDNPNLTYLPEDRLLLGGVYTTGDDNPVTLMTTTNQEAAVFPTIEKSDSGERTSLAIAAPWDIATACGSTTLTLVGIPVGFAAHNRQAVLQ